MKQYGRKEIFTDVPEVTSENLIKVLKQAMIDFMPNADACERLIKYESGYQPISRQKTSRTEIDYHVTDNIANEVVQFKVSYNWGNPITLIQRGEKDSGDKGEADAISILNEYYDAEEIKKKQQELARFVEICGIGYTIVEINTEWEEGDSPFTINVLDPRCAFVVRSKYYTDHRIVLGVTFRDDWLGNYYFTCYTKNDRFEVLNTVKIINQNGDYEDRDEWNETARSGELNPMHRIPVVEWIRDYDRMGCFERCISEMDNLNVLVSDVTNDVEQNTMAIWHTNDVDFPKTQNEDGTQTEDTDLKSGDLLQTYTTPDGKTPIVEPLSIDYDYDGMLSHIQYRVARIKEKCNVPQRSDASNATGIAVSDSSGWTNADIEATRQDQIKYGCKMEEVKCALAAIKETALAKVDSNVLNLKYRDLKPSIKRQKNYEMSVKSTTLANLLSHGVYGLHALNTVGLFEDVNQVWSDSREIIERYQSSIFDKNTESNNEDNDVQTTDGGYEAQIGNSTQIDGMSKEAPVAADGS